MQHEYNALMKNGTWVLVSNPSLPKVISCKWVYKLKLKFNGDIERYKARFYFSRL